MITCVSGSTSEALCNLFSATETDPKHILFPSCFCASTISSLKVLRPTLCIEYYSISNLDTSSFAHLSSKQYAVIVSIQLISDECLYLLIDLLPGNPILIIDLVGSLPNWRTLVSHFAHTTNHPIFYIASPRKYLMLPTLSFSCTHHASFSFSISLTLSLQKEFSSLYSWIKSIVYYFSIRLRIVSIYPFSTLSISCLPPKLSIASIIIYSLSVPLFPLLKRHLTLRLSRLRLLLSQSSFQVFLPATLISGSITPHQVLIKTSHPPDSVALSEIMSLLSRNHFVYSRWPDLDPHQDALLFIDSLALLESSLLVSLL